ncbi:MAG: cysteine desulfurase family protein [Flavobacteriales bacterium]
MNIYLDNAATTPLDKRVLDAMMPFMTDYFGNPSSSHAFGRKTKTAIENSRRTIAKALNCLPSEIYFTSGGTEADNLAMHAAVYDLGCNHIITSPIEHSAIVKTAQMYSDKGIAKLSMVNLTPNGHIDLAHLEELLKYEGKSYVTLMHGNNEIANLLPLEKVSELCQNAGAIFHSDTVQTMGHYSFDLQKTPIHFINAAAHKFHGPKGVGFIYINKSIKINGTITGGGQERGLRGGTENLYGIVGLGKAIELAYEHLEEHQNHVGELKQYMISELKSNIPGIEFNGDCTNSNSLYTVLNVTFPPTPNFDMLLFLLDLEGIACSGGSACSSGATKGSHVLDAINALKEGRASLRFSFSRFTNKEEIDYAVSKIKELCAVPVEA